MALAFQKFDDKLKLIFSKMKKDPERESEYRKEYVTWIFEYMQNRIEDARQDVILTLCYQLYKADYVALRSDLGRIIVEQLNREASEEERFELLKCLADSIELYMHGDYSPILNYLGNVCTLAEIMKDTEEDDDLPFD